jgi:hypothetical protein
MAKEYLVLCVGGLEYVTMRIIDESIKDAFAKTSQLPTEYSIRCLTDPDNVVSGHAGVGQIYLRTDLSYSMISQFRCIQCLLAFVSHHNDLDITGEVFIQQ